MERCRLGDPLGGRKCTFYRGASCMRRGIKTAHTYFLARFPARSPVYGAAWRAATATSLLLDRLRRLGKRAPTSCLYHVSKNQRTVPREKTETAAPGNATGPKFHSTIPEKFSLDSSKRSQRKKARQKKKKKQEQRPRAATSITGGKSFSSRNT